MGLYDLRIDADEQPYILEAALFCSFSPLSVIPAMAAHSDREDLRHPHFFHSLLDRASEKARKAPARPPALAFDPAARATTVDTLSDVDRQTSEEKSSSDPDDDELSRHSSDDKIVSSPVRSD